MLIVRNLHEDDVRLDRRLLRRDGARKIGFESVAHALEDVHGLSALRGARDGAWRLNEGTERLLQLRQEETRMP